MRTIAITLTLATLMSSCAMRMWSTTMPTSRFFKMASEAWEAQNATMDGLVGQKRIAVLQELGLPDSEIGDGDKGSIMVYDHYDSRGTTQTISYRNDGATIRTRGERPYSRTLVFLDESGNVTNWSWNAVN